MNELTEEQSQAHIVLAYNLQMALNDIFAKDKNYILTHDVFMELQHTLWQEVKKELNITQEMISKLQTEPKR